MGETATNPVKATRRSLEVLETLYRTGGARLTEVVDILDLPDSTVHNHLSTLVESGFVIRENDVYRISLRFLTYGDAARSRYRIAGICEREVSELAREADECVSVVVAEAGSGYVIAKESGADSVPVNIYPGKRFPLHTSAHGKILLADLPETGVYEIVDRHGLESKAENTITETDQLLAELEAVRDQGYAISNGERLDGVKSIATGVKNDSGVTIGALGITGPANRLPDDRIQDSILQTLTNSKNILELMLTYS